MLIKALKGKNKLYNITMLRFRQKALIVAVALIMPFSLAFAQTGSFWDALLSFFGFSSSSTSTVSDNLNNSGSGEVLNTGDILNSSGPSTQDQEEESSAAPLTYNFENIIIVPDKVELGEPYLVAFRCPEKERVVNSSFDAQKEAENGVVKLYAKKDKNKEFIECSLNTASSSSKTYYASLSVLDSAIKEFYINPENPQNGALTTLFWNAGKDARCEIVSSLGAFSKQTSNSGSISFNAKKGDGISIKCSDERGIIKKKVIYIK